MRVNGHCFRARSRMPARRPAQHDHVTVQFSGTTLASGKYGCCYRGSAIQCGPCAFSQIPNRATTGRLIKMSLAAIISAVDVTVDDLEYCCLLDCAADWPKPWLVAKDARRTREGARGRLRAGSA